MKKRTLSLRDLDKKKARLDAFRPLPSEMVRNLEDWFRIELTYTSNAIEGNTLTRQETAVVVEKGMTVQGKSLKEHLEAINHAEALDHIKKMVIRKTTGLQERDVLDIHRMILAKIDDQNAGRYRTVPIRIAGSTVIMPNSQKISRLMETFIDKLHGAESSPVQLAAEAHLGLVSIHPFIDGNGRTARLLMNLILIQKGYPPALIRKEDRLKYINAIEKAQLKGDLRDYHQVIYEAVDRSLDVYLDLLEGKTHRKKAGKASLLKIGVLARQSGVPVSTIRFWTQEGLLAVDSHTPGGYALYPLSAIGVIKKIRRLQQERRLHISEIKRIL